MDQLLFGLSVTLIGMLVVFLGLAVLILCIKIMSMVTASGEKQKMKAGRLGAPMETEASPVVPVTEVPASGGVSNEVFAAITAAVAAVWQGEKGFMVRHVKRIHNAPAWNRAGREEQTYSRF